jgi:hypothetical protein
MNASAFSPMRARNVELSDAVMCDFEIDEDLGDNADDYAIGD